MEDAPSGLRAGHAAGSKTLAVCTSHTRAKIEESGSSPDFIVADLSRSVHTWLEELFIVLICLTFFANARVSARWVDGKVVVEIDDRAD